ncbi:MAG: ComEC/Rec2 family competence protein [candidate division WWE3 bacterium]|nr:ComEC/Rec2 family competence protein [candidate division WWE3 bacterium]
MNPAPTFIRFIFKYVFMSKETLIDILIVTLLALAIFVRYQTIKLVPPTKDMSYEITVTLQQIPKVTGQYQRFKLGQVTIIARYPPVYNYGDTLTVKGTLNTKLEMPFPKINRQSSIVNRQSVITQLQAKLLTLRATLSHQLAKYLPSPEAELVGGALWGEKANLPADFNQALKDITIFGIVIFVMLTGAESPAIRAGIMGGLVVIGRYFGREKDTIRLLIISALVMLLINPLYVEDVGFQLSFLATLGILLFSTKKTPNTKKLKSVEDDPWVVPTNLKETSQQTAVATEHPPSSTRSIITKFISWLRNTSIYEELRTTLAAQILVIPILATTFGRLSLISPIANLAVGWTIPYLMAGGALLTAVSPFSNFLGRVLGAILVVPASFYVSTVTMLAKVPYAAVDFKWGSEFLVVYYLIVGVILLIRGKSNP